MLQIKNMLGGGKPEGLYVWKKNEIGSELKIFNKSVSTLPYEFPYSSAVVLNGEIHILGGNYNSTAKKRHYKFDGSSWTSVSTLPYSFEGGCAVVLNGEIHILGTGTSGYYTSHYKWDGSSWTSVSTLPYNLYLGCAVVLNGEIHILGGDANNSVFTRHYKWDGSSWTSVSTLPYSFRAGSAVVLNNEIHILGSSDTSVRTNHYKFDGTTWVSVSTLPYQFYGGSAVAFDNEIHILGTYSGDGTQHYKFDGTTWVSVSTLPYQFYYGSAVVFDNGIHILSSNSSSYYYYHYLIIGYVPVYTFLDYIVSDKETAYPDGGEKGGYWYERVVGGAKVAYGSITLSNSTDAVIIPHGLGKTPTLFALLPKLLDSSISQVVGSVFYCGTENIYRYLSAGSSYLGLYDLKQYNSNKSQKVSVDETNINAPTGYLNKSVNAVIWSGTYEWIAVAE